MAIQLSSDDVATGDIYNGTWNFTQTVQGDFNIIYQYISTHDIPWIWDGVNNLKIGFNFNEELYSIIATLDTTYGLSNDFDAIAILWEIDIQDALDELKVETGDTIETFVAVTYSSATGWFTLVFSGQPEDVELLYSDAQTTCGGVFGISATQTHASTFTIPNTYMITNPKYLYMKINQSGTTVNISKNFYPTCILSTSDNQVVNQGVSFFNNTNQLGIKIYRTNVINSPVPLQNKWDLILQ